VFGVELGPDLIGAWRLIKEFKSKIVKQLLELIFVAVDANSYVAFGVWAAQSHHLMKAFGLHLMRKF
jgi:hypothetical protein